MVSLLAVIMLGIILLTFQVCEVEGFSPTTTTAFQRLQGQQWQRYPLYLTNDGLSFFPKDDAAGPSRKRQQQQRQCRLANTSITRLNAFPSYIGSPWGEWMILLGNAALAQVLGRSTAIGKLLGAPVTAMALTFVMATTAAVILPASGSSTGASAGEATKVLQLLALQLATPLVLLGAESWNIPEMARDCKPMIAAFSWASMATLVACIIGWKLLGGALTVVFGGASLSLLLPLSPLKNDALILAAALMAKNIGGGINYMAVCAALQASPTATTAGLCIDNIFALIYFPVTSFLANGRADPGALVSCKKEELEVQEENNNNSKDTATTNDEKDKTRITTTSTAAYISSNNSNNNNTVTVESVTAALFVSAALLWLGQQLSDGGGTGGAALPLSTLLTVVLALGAYNRWFPYVDFIRFLQPAAQMLGTVALYVFFSTAGAVAVGGGGVIAAAKNSTAMLLLLSTYLLLLYSIHGGILWIAHGLFQKLWPQTMAVPRLLCASSAAIGGPATAVTLAQSAKWPSLQLPSLLVGNIGYAVATFLGLAFYGFFSMP